MPVILPDQLPAKQVLIEEDPDLVTDTLSATDGSGLSLAILNLMPQKVVTETQLLRMIGRTPYGVSVTLIRTASHTPKNTPLEYLEKFYKTFRQVENQHFDGLIITGAPVETLEFEQVDYWNELCEVLDWRLENVGSTYHICWAVQAAVYKQYGIPKYGMPEKVFGVFDHHRLDNYSGLLDGLGERFMMPHSRHTEVRQEDIAKVPQLRLVSTSEEAGVFLFISDDNRQVYVTGHPEYDPNTLRNEYERDLRKGLPIALPKNYFIDDQPGNQPLYQWKLTGPLLYANWLENVVVKNANLEYQRK